MDTWQGITISELLTGRKSIVIAKDTIKLFHQTLRVLYSDPEPESFRGVDSEDLLAAFSTTSKPLERILSKEKKEETPGPNLVGPTFRLQQTRAMLPDKLNILIAEAPQLQKPYKHHQVLERLPYLEHNGSAPVNNAPTRKDGNKETHAWVQQLRDCMRFIASLYVLRFFDHVSIARQEHIVMMEHTK